MALLSNSKDHPKVMVTSCDRICVFARLKLPGTRWFELIPGLLLKTKTRTNALALILPSKVNMFECRLSYFDSLANIVREIYLRNTR